VTTQDGPQAGPEDRKRDDAPRTDPDPPREDAQDAFGQVLDELRRVQAQLEQLVRIQVDRLKIQWRDRLLGAAWVVLAVVILAVATVAAVFYSMAGLSGMITQTLEGPAWLGDLVVGVSVLVLLVGGLAIGGFVVRRRGLARLRESYEGQPSSDEPEESRS